MWGKAAGASSSRMLDTSSNNWWLTWVWLPSERIVQRCACHALWLVGSICAVFFMTIPCMLNVKIGSVRSSGPEGIKIVEN